MNYVIIVAAGTGSRFASVLPKQFCLLAGKPVLMHTIEQFASSRLATKIILVLSSDRIDYWQELTRQHNFNVPHHICAGGANRYQSVKAGLDYIASLNPQENKELKIGIHDGARPLVSADFIDELYANCNQARPALIPALQSSNSVRIGTAAQNQAISRDSVWLVQTPQVFLASAILDAYKLTPREDFTDDASVYEAAGGTITLHPGRPENIKITLNQDLAIVSLLLEKLEG